MQIVIGPCQPYGSETHAKPMQNVTDLFKQSKTVLQVFQRVQAESAYILFTATPWHTLRPNQNS